ncbi:MAG: fatty acid hydroxylase [Calditrichaeota bacterium]|nr:MAG: fatty acid hydroxylase [Calditrichota bacterium]
MSIVKSDEPIRIFKSDFLEFFTHIYPWQILMIWLPFSAYTFFLSISQDAPINHFILLFSGMVIGVVLWTLTEYTLHRFLFHFPAKKEFSKRIIFLFHGVHHNQPMCKSRLVMPPIVSIPLAAVFISIFHLFFKFVLRSPWWTAPVTTGFVLGYLYYDLFHYASHHMKLKNKNLIFMRKWHMRHHGSTPDKRFGVSNPFWDKVFGTSPDDK